MGQDFPLPAGAPAVLRAVPPYVPQAARVDNAARDAVPDTDGPAARDC